MGGKRERRQTIILIAISLAIVSTGLYFLIKNYNPDEFSSVKNTPYPKLLFKINQGKLWGKLKEPMQVLSYHGRIYVSDTGNSRVLAFDMKGRFLFEFENKLDKKDRHLQFPYGLAADPSGNIYVADMTAGKVMIFDEKGQFIRYLNQDSRYINKPAGIFVYQNRVYVSDIGSHKINVFDRKGKFVMSIGSGHNGVGNEDLYYPNAVVVDRSGKIYVSDSMNNRVQVFSSSGKYLETVASEEGLGLQNPRGLAIDSAGNIYVASTLNKSIKCFDKDGIFLFDMVRDNNYSLSLPVGLYIDSFNNIYVTDLGGNQLMVFKK